jgi:hypothetical protein
VEQVEGCTRERRRELEGLWRIMIITEATGELGRGRRM